MSCTPILTRAYYTEVTDLLLEDAKVSELLYSVGTNVLPVLQINQSARKLSETSNYQKRNVIHTKSYIQNHDPKIILKYYLELITNFKINTTNIFVKS